VSQLTQKTVAKVLGASLLLLGSQLAFSTDSGQAISAFECAKNPLCAKEILGAKIKDTIVKTGAATAVVTPIVIGGTTQPVADAVAPVVVVDGQGSVYYWSQAQNQTAQQLAMQKFYQTYCTNPLNDPLCGSVIDVHIQAPSTSSMFFRVGQAQYYIAYKIEDCFWNYGAGPQYVGPTFLLQQPDGIWQESCQGARVIPSSIFIQPVNAPTWSNWPEADREKAVDLLTAEDWGRLVSTMPVAGKLNPGETVRAPEIIIPGADTDDPNTPLIDERLHRVVTPSYTLPNGSPSPTPSPEPLPSPEPTPSLPPLPSPSPTSQPTPPPPPPEPQPDADGAGSTEGGDGKTGNDQIDSRDRYLDTRAKELASLMDSFAQAHRTIAVARVRNPNGTTEQVVAISNGRFNVLQKSAMEKAGEIIIKDDGSKTHAESRIISWATANGKVVEAIGTSRDICPPCWQMMQANNVKRASNLQPPKGRPTQRRKPIQ
jgi:hypothetical protein